MLRYSLLWSYVIVAIFVSFKDWFKALCMTFVLIAVIERPDMPREIFGIPGLNPYNIIFAFILLGWVLQKNKESLTWNMPQNLSRLFILYLVFFTISFSRMVADHKGFNVHPMPGLNTSFSSLFLRDYLNSLKYLLPGLLILHGTNSKERFRLAVWSLLLFGMLLSLQVISKMIPALIGQDDLASRAARILDRDIGYHRVNVAAITAGFSWAFFSLVTTSRSLIERAYSITGFIACSLAMALSGGRAGMLAWLGCGLLMALIKWRTLLLVGPLVGILALSAIPGLESRLMQGLSHDSQENVHHRDLNTIDSEGRDMYSATSGRIIAWPLVIERIKRQLLFGYGKRAMIRLGIAHEVTEVIGARSLDFVHPHNAYLELLLDHGLVGAIPILLLFSLIAFKTIPYIRETNDSNVTLGASLAFSFMITQAIAGLGSQSFYPEIGSFPMWVGIGLFFSVIALKDAKKLDGSEEPLSPKKRTRYY